MIFIISFTLFFIVLFLIYLLNYKKYPRIFLICICATSIYMGLMYLHSGSIQSINYFEKLAVQIQDGKNLKPEELIIFLEKKIKDNPKDLEGMLILARSYLLSGYIQKAEKSYKSLIEAYPNNEDVLFETALFKRKNNDIITSIKLLEEIRALNEMNLQSRIFLAELYIEINKFKKAEDEIRFLKKNSKIDESILEELKKKLKN